MNLEEAILYLEDYYTENGLDYEFVTDEVKSLRKRIDEAFKISLPEWESNLLYNPDYALVEFSRVNNYRSEDKEGNINFFKGNNYAVAVVPRNFANIWHSYFTGAILYSDGKQLYDDASSKEVLSDFSLDTKYIYMMLEEIEKSGSGLILEMLEQCVQPFLSENGMEIGISERYREKKELGKFIEREDGRVQFCVINNDLRYLIMFMAANKFGDIPKKLMYPKN